MRQTTVISGPAERPFETRDFYLACFLKWQGYDLLALRAEPSRKVFVFRDKPERSGDVIAFFADSATVPPMAFSSTIKDMKGLLYNA